MAIKERPRYRINAENPGSEISFKNPLGQVIHLGCVAPGAEISLPDYVAPHTMWLPLNDAAKACFARHKKEFLEKAKADGATEEQLTSMAKRLDPLPDKTPQMKKVEDEGSEEQDEQIELAKPARRAAPTARISDG